MKCPCYFVFQLAFYIYKVKQKLKCQHSRNYVCPRQAKGRHYLFKLSIRKPEPSLLVLSTVQYSVSRAGVFSPQQMGFNLLNAI